MSVTKQIHINVLGEMSEEMAIAAVNHAVRSAKVAKHDPTRDLKVLIGEDEIFLECYPSGSGNTYHVWKYEK